ncbi:MAG: DUF6428 family protein [Balneolales bacterium]
MRTSEFIELLEKHPQLPLYFEYQSGKYVRADYHITEIKNVTYDTVDCGGLQNQWQETHVQLWENEMPEPGHEVDTTKALKIFQVVEKVRPTFQETEVKFEYGNASFPTAVLPISNVVMNDASLIVQLISGQTTCKAKDRASSPEEAASACCGTPVKQSIPIAEVSANGCTPGGECC